MAGPIFQPPPQLVQQAADIQKEATAEQKDAEREQSIRDVTGNMVDVLSNSANPKHRNSKFLKFLNKLNHGAYTIENEQLVKHPEKIKEFRTIDTKRREKEAMEEETKLQGPEADI